MLLLSNKYMLHQEEAWWNLWIINQHDYNNECSQIYRAIWSVKAVSGGESGKSGIKAGADRAQPWENVEGGAPQSRETPIIQPSVLLGSTKTWKHLFVCVSYMRGLYADEAFRRRACLLHKSHNGYIN